MLQHLIGGLTVLGNKDSIIWLLVGSIGGMIFGVIPGLGGIVILSIALALVNHISLAGMLCIFLGVQAASFFSASITSILLNTPAHPEAFAVTFDGFPMAQRGEAGRALGISASATCLGGIIGCIALVGFIQILNSISIIFHPPQYVALVVLSLILVGTLGTDSLSKGVISGGIGIMLAAVGSSTITGGSRYTFGSVGLLDGISLVALALGCFSIPQMVLVYGTSTTVARQDMNGRELDASAPVDLGKGFSKQVVEGVRDTLRHWVILIVSGIVGVVTGIIPGIGAFAANFLSYGIAQQTSPNRRLFGTGVAEGIIAPEGSSLSKEAGGMVPVMGLGIPSGVGGALFLAVLEAKNIRVGYDFTVTYTTLPYEIAWIILITGIIGTAIGLAAAPLLARITKVPGPLLVPFVLALSVFGTFVASQSFFAVMECVIFGLVGFGLRRLQYSLASFVVGLVLGPTLENNLYLTHNLFPGFAALKYPLTDVILAILLAFLISRGVQTRQDKRLALAGAEVNASSTSMRSIEATKHPYPMLALIATTLIAAGSLAYVVYGISEYSFTTGIMAFASGSIVAFAALCRLPVEIRNFIRYSKVRRSNDFEATLASRNLAEDKHSGSSTAESSSEIIEMQSAGESPLGANVAVSPHEIDVETAFTDLVERGHFPQIVEKSWGRHGQYRRELICLAWFGFLVSLCFVFGFTVGMPIFSVSYSLIATKRVLTSLKSRLIFAAISGVVLWFMSFEIFNALHLIFKPII